MGRSSGAIRRLRGFPSLEALLRTLLLHVGCGWSLRETAVQAKLAGIASVSRCHAAESSPGRGKLAAAVMRAVVEEQRRPAAARLQGEARAAAGGHGGERTSHLRCKNRPETWYTAEREGDNSPPSGYARRCCMPWKESRIMDQRLQFLSSYQKEDMSVADLCREYGISARRATVGSTATRRGPEGLVDRSRRPHGCSHARLEPIENAILALRAKHPSLGRAKAKSKAGDATARCGVACSQYARY